MLDGENEKKNSILLLFKEGLLKKALNIHVLFKSVQTLYHYLAIQVDFNTLARYSSSSIKKQIIFQKLFKELLFKQALQSLH